MTLNVETRTMQPREFDETRSMAIAAFDDESIGDLLDTLRASWGWHDELSMVAVIDDEIVGHVHFSPAWIDAPATLVDVLVLSPVSVRPDMQRKGIGTNLITDALVAVAQRPEPLVFLEGDPSYYRRFGFEAGAGHGFTPPSVRIPGPAFQVIKQPHYREGSVSGALVYPDAFWRTDSVGLR